MVMKKGESMKIQERLSHALILMLALILFIPAGVFGQDAAKKTFSQEELDQMLAPIALYPDSLMAQVLMAATYPLEIVQADRFAKKNKDLKGDKLLEAQASGNTTESANDPSIQDVDSPQQSDPQPAPQDEAAQPVTLATPIEPLPINLQDVLFVPLMMSPVLAFLLFIVGKIRLGAP